MPQCSREVWRSSVGDQIGRLAILILGLLALPAMPGRVDARHLTEHRFTFTIRTTWQPAMLIDSATCGDLPRDELLKELTSKGAARVAKDPSLLTLRLARQLLMRQLTREIYFTLYSNRDTLLLARTLSVSVLGPSDPLPLPERLQGEYKALDYDATFDSLPSRPPRAARCQLMVRELEGPILASETPHPIGEAITVDPDEADSLRRQGWTVWRPIWTAAGAEFQINPALIQSRLYIPSEHRYARDCREGIRYALLAAMLPAERWARKEWRLARLPRTLENDPWAFATFLVQRAEERH